ncbi:hypothetical protein [Alkaliphilus hydrothermalis]|uniref:Uncharacterized protein n=1 Tax=Alkaliphilus hydrothermalis TaxID=1482730 RepID=A0ABS2NRF4_9FIRM|nr:hypothetical protein [Alkaliphilus hydrothermalis]MBM7615532.1 hypothetical protein [Alkaliphilus hydrothermalis]
MVDFTKELKVSKILLKEDILRLRKYIENKYPHDTQQRRAQILANAIEGVVEKPKNLLPSK